MTVLVGIAGGTCSGKTSLAVKIRDRVGEDRCLLIAQDSYYKDGSTLTPAAQASLTYDHATYSRRVLPDPLKPMPVVILEGILILAEEPLRRLMDIKLFIDTDADVRIR